MRAPLGVNPKSETPSQATEHMEWSEAQICAKLSTVATSRSPDARVGRRFLAQAPLIAVSTEPQKGRGSGAQRAPCRNLKVSPRLRRPRLAKCASPGRRLGRRRLLSEYMTGNYFGKLGIGTFGGRVFTPDDD
jgi:hypothetical protein